MNLPVLPVSSLATLINGYPFDSDDFSDTGDLPLVRVRDVLGSKFETFIPRAVVPHHAVVLDGDVVIGMDGDFNSQLWHRGPAALNQRVCLLRVGQHIDPRFLSYAITEPLRRINALTYSTTVKHLSSSRIKRITLQYPGLQTSRATADYLDRETAQIDALLDKQQRLIANLHERRNAVRDVLMSETASDGASSRLKHHVTAVQQGWSPECFSWSTDGVEEWAVLKTGCTNWGTFRAEENKALPPTEEPRPDTVVRQGQIVISRASTRALVGSAALVTQSYPRLMLSDKLYAFTLNSSALPGYVVEVLNTTKIRDLIQMEATGSSPSMQNVSQADLLNLPMPLPTVPRQRELVESITRATTPIDELINRAERFVKLAKERRAALITAAVTGQIDVGSAA